MVFLVAVKRQTCMGHLNTDLVVTASLQVDGYQGIFFIIHFIADSLLQHLK